MFKVGDIVEITSESSATGVLDFEDGKGYAVLNVGLKFNSANLALIQIKLVDESGRMDWYAASHFKLKEGAKVEKEECLFKKGQVVWDVVKGSGVIGRVDTEATRCIGAMPVIVVFDSGEQRDYSYEGVSNFPVAPAFVGKRTLFFSEPKIEAATEPVFEPVLEKGEWVVLSDNTAQAIVKVVSETSTELFYEGDGVVTFVNKGCVSVYRLGEKIEFN